MSDPFKLSIYCLVESGEKVLLTEDVGKPGWKLPGGEVKKGELLLEATKREVKEETGLIVDPSGFVSLQDYINEKKEHRLRFYLTAKLVSGRKKPNIGEVKKIKWFSKEDLRKLQMKDFFIKQYFWAVKEFLSGKVFPLTLLTTF
jgi:8-oxo-dGTP diphosphatase